MLTVVMTSMPASSSSSTSCQRFSWRLPGTLVWASSSTSATAGSAGEDRVDVHLLERRCRGSRRCAAGHDLEVAELRLRLGPAVGLDEADDDVGAALLAAPALVEHGEGLADAGRGAEVDAQQAPLRRADASVMPPRASVPVEGEVELEHVHAGLAEDAPLAAARCAASTSASTWSTVMPRACGDAGGLQLGVGHGDVRVEAGAGRGDGVDGHRLRSAARPFSLR